MADQLYLSLWFPNFRIESLPDKLVAVMRQLAALSPTPAGKRVHAAAAFPIAFSEAPVYQRLYVTDDRAEDNRDTAASIIETAVAEATEHLHDDVAYEFEMKWTLWLPDTATAAGITPDALLDPAAQLDTLWRPEPRTIRILGFGPEFDSSTFEQNGHIRVDFGLDYPWVLDDESTSSDDDETLNNDPLVDIDDDPADDLDANLDDDSADDLAHKQDQRNNLLSFQRDDPAQPEAADFIRRNIELLLAFTLSVEKNCGVSSRLLWTESGEPLAEKLIARLQRLN